MAQASPKMFQQIQSTTCGVFFTIEGNIGCGKSSFLKVLRQRIPELVSIQEPVQEWQQIGPDKTNMLERYYSDPQRWGFTFLNLAAFTRMRAVQEATESHPKGIKISQRSILADRQVFAEAMRDLKYMGESEYEVFRSLYNSYRQMTPIDSTKIVYLRCTPEKCHERTSNRRRPQEKQIFLEYLQLLHAKHEQWMTKEDPRKVLVLDTTEDFLEDQSRLQKMLESLQEFIRRDGP